MKYPLRIVRIVEKPYDWAIADATGKIICTMADDPWAHTLANYFVSSANRWHKIKPWFRPYMSSNWLLGKNTYGKIEVARRDTRNSRNTSARIGKAGSRGLSAGL